MPKKTKSIPVNRAEWRFGNAVWWHFFIHGTPPDGSAAQATGRVWSPQTATAELGLASVRTLWNWVDNDPPPYDTTALERVLFGNSTHFDDWREELRRLLADERARPKANDPKPKPTGRAVVLYAMDYEDASQPEIIDAEFEEITPDAAEMSGNGRTTRNPNGFKRGAIVAAGIALLIGYASTRQSGEPSKPAVPRTETSTVPRPTDDGRPAVTDHANTDRQSPPTTTPPPANPPSKVAPPPQVKETRAPEPPKPTIQPVEKPTAEEDMMRETIAALQARQQAERIAREQEAIRRDAEERKATQAIIDRDRYTHDIAGMGFAVKEGVSISVGRSLGPTDALTVQDCALSCLRDGCDGFAYYRDEVIGPASKGRACYRYKKPLTFFANGGYVGGERIADVVSPSPLDPTAAPVPAPKPDSMQLTEAGAAPSIPSAPDASADGITRCATGPVKVTGFTLQCDKLATGGTTLGSAQLSYTVNDINDCAAKCRPLQRCTTFAFNSADPPNRRSCMIFGGQTGFYNGTGGILGRGSCCRVLRQQSFSKQSNCSKQRDAFR